MQNMGETAAFKYLKFIDKSSYGFYCKNTIGKFKSLLCGWKKNTNSELAMNSGILREVVDIVNPDELRGARSVFLEKFCPGSKWAAEKHSSSQPWTHYYHALYSKIQ